MVDLQCVWDDETKFVRFEGDFFGERSNPRKTWQRRTGLPWILPVVCSPRLELWFLSEAFSRAFFGGSVGCSILFLFWVVISARRFWFGTMEMSVESTELGNGNRGWRIDTYRDYYI